MGIRIFEAVCLVPTGRSMRSSHVLCARSGICKAALDTGGLVVGRFLFRCSCGVAIGFAG